jgi:O-antigen ligase
MFRMALTGRFRMRLPIVNVAFILWITYALLTWVACVTVLHYPGYDAKGAGIELKSELFDSVLFFFVYFYGIEGERDFFLMAKTLAFWIGLANILTLADVAGVVHLGITVGQNGVEADRVFGVFGHANDTAALIVCVLPMMVAVAMSSRGAARLFWYGGALASVAVLLLTVSRGAYVGVVVGYAMAVWLCRRHLPASRVFAWTLIGSTCVVIAAGLAAVLLPEFSQVITQRIFDQSMSGSISVASSGRTDIWMTAISTMMAHPITLLTGYGFRVYQTMFVLVTHNYYLDQWFGLGLIGLVALVTIQYQTVATGLRAVAAGAGPLRPYMIALVFGMLGLAVSIFFDNMDKPWSYVWIYVGFSLRAAVELESPARAALSPVGSRSTVRTRTRARPSRRVSVN